MYCWCIVFHLQIRNKAVPVGGGGRWIPLIGIYRGYSASADFGTLMGPSHVAGLVRPLS